MKLFGNGSVYINGGFTYLQHIKEVIGRLKRGTHMQWIPERTKDADSEKSAQRPINRLSPQASQDWEISISAVADTTVLHNSINPFFKFPTTWYVILTVAGGNYLPASEISRWL